MGELKKNIEKQVNFFKHGKLQTRQRMAAHDRATVAADVENAKVDMFANAQMPDADAIKRTERRKAARRKGSRVETILTDQLGG